MDALKTRLVLGMGGAILLTLGILIGISISSMVSADEGDTDNRLSALERLLGGNASALAEEAVTSTAPVEACLAPTLPIALFLPVKCSLIGWKAVMLDEDWQDTGTGVLHPFDISAKVGIGTTNPNAKLEVVGLVKTSALEVECPSGFVNVSSSGNQLGCIQEDRVDAGATELFWQQATDYCFDNYGGRLPSTGEWYISLANFNLLGENPTGEWNNDFGDVQDTHAASIWAGTTSLRGLSSDTSPREFRCWLPR